MPFTLQTKNPGDLVKSQDWNDAMQEIARLGSDKVNRSGDTVIGSLNITGAVQTPILNSATTFNLQTANTTRMTVDTNGKVQINGELNTTGNVQINGELYIPNSNGGAASLTKQRISNESEFRKNNVKLRMASTTGLLTNPPLEYEFSIGHTTQIAILSPPKFVKRFSVNERGDAYFAGAKTGYVVDYFVNRVGDILEQGDVIALSSYPVTHYSGSQNDIPIPEVDLATTAYDSRVCGIVAKFVTEQDLPYVEVEPEQDVQLPPEAVEELASETMQPSVHPLHQLAGKLEEGTDPRQVQNQQLGTMVTLGAYAHCKVDADIAPIAVGDLLTTSPTKGHAQKVLEPGRAIGAIIGKALGSLEKGRGKIPILVMLQ
jgi:hypothetical protein